MFTVSAPSPIHHIIGYCRPTTSKHHAYANECDEMASMRPKLSTASTGSSSSIAGGLRRTVSSLQSAKPCLLANHANDCVVEAKQVEMDFATLTTRAFYLTITAPNGEKSERLAFPHYGQTAHFTPCRDGCGHGNWEFCVETRDGRKFKVESREKLYLDGVGTLFFTVDDNLHVKLTSQEFLRLPSASQCCSRKARKL